MSGTTLLERDEPRRRLEAAISAARKGQGRIVALEGEAGIGKSALTLAFVDAQRGEARVHVGGCEHLATPEPMGPLRDIARESQGRFAISTLGQLATFESLLRLLTNGKGPALLALEDIHWADDATLDALRFLARRIRTAPVMVLATFRNDEPDSRARLVSLWADMPRDARERIELRPLSLDAVAQLSARSGRLAREVYEATGGNPFNVTEYLAAEADVVPRSVQEVTVARAAAMSAHGRRTLECASIFPRRIDERTLRAIAEDVDHSGVEECLASGMLNESDGVLAFRHELARRAIHESMSPLRRRDLHAAALHLLKQRGDARAAELAHHAEQAGALPDLLQFSILAAEEAGRFGAHREVVAHLSRAIDQRHLLTPAQRAQLLARKGFAAHYWGDLAVAVAALDEAVAIHRAEGDDVGVGNALRMLGHVHWLLGQPALAEDCLDRAVQVLSAHRDSWQYAQALASHAQFDMLADRNAKAIALAEEALARAEKLQRWDIHIQALTFLQTARASTNLDEGLVAMRATIEHARKQGQLDAVPRLYTNITSVMAAARRHEGFIELQEQGMEACAARDQAGLQGYLRGNLATVYLDTGRLEEAVSVAEDVVHGPYPKGTVTLAATIALSRARIRLGIPEGGLLDQARRMPTAQRDLLWRVPVAIADAEAHWLDGSRAGAVERLAEVHAAVVQTWSQLWNIGETALWLAILGKPPRLSPDAASELSSAHRAQVEGRWAEAAGLWAERGCPYEQAIALSCGDEAARRQALIIFDRIGAAPAARKLRRALRADGVRALPSGPRAARREDPAGLTPRQNDVLQLLGDGLANADIADRLGLSAKTVEHHVSAILAALEAPSRLAAVQIARERGLHRSN